MTRQPPNNFRYFCLLVSALMILTVGANASETKTQTNTPGNSAIAAILLEAFGPAVEPVATFTPYQLNGDFNGDGAPDTLVIVRIKGSRSQLLKDVTVLNPFYGGQIKYPVNPNKEPTLAFAIIHGASKLKPHAPTRKFLLIGESPILILENSRAISAEANDRKDLMELVKKRGKRARTAMPPPTIAKGDSVSLPTEAADSILFWNGKTYRWQESEGGE